MKGIKLTGLLWVVAMALAASGCSWEELHRSITDSAQQHRCAERTEAVRQEYGRLRAYLSHNQIPAQTFVRQTVFGQMGGTSYKSMYFLKSYNFEGEKVDLYLRTERRQPWLTTAASSEAVYHLDEEASQIILMPNEFPYRTEAGIEHWIMWMNRSNSLERVNAILGDVVGRGYETVAYINTRANKSVKDLNHAQVFIRKQSW